MTGYEMRKENQMNRNDEVRSEAVAREDSEVEPHGLKEVVTVGAAVAALAGSAAGTAAAASSGAASDGPETVLISRDAASPAEIAQSYFDHVWNGDPAGGEKLTVDGYGIFGPQAQSDQGGCTKRIAEIVGEYQQGFPDLRFDVQNISAEGDTVTIDWVAGGTHRGTFWGIDATGVEVRVPGSTTYTFQNQLITQEDYSFDVGGVFDQLGSGR